MTRTIFILLLLNSCIKTNPNTQKENEVENSKKIELKDDLSKSDNYYEEEHDTVNYAIIESNNDIIVYYNTKLFLNFFGYEKPNTNLKKIIHFSMYTNYVEENPFKCKFGTFYSSETLDNLQIKFTASKNNFIKAKIIDWKNKETNVFFEKKWIKFNR